MEKDILTAKEAIKWYEDEIVRLKNASMINGCKMLPEWEQQIQIHMMALQALEQQGNKCSFGCGVKILPDGKHELDPCIYKTLEEHKNATVRVLQCKKCGHIEIEWERQDDTTDEELDVYT